MQKRTHHIKENAKIKPYKQAKIDKALTDIVELILDDHIPLKRLIAIMKDSDRDIMARAAAFGEFAPLLVAHAKPEEQSLYVFMKKNEDLREEGFEGEVEHILADQMLEELKREDDKDIWSAKLKVLAELVEHHIQEEEEELLPDFAKHCKEEDRIKLGREFLMLKDMIENQGSDDSPSEEILKHIETH